MSMIDKLREPYRRQSKELIGAREEAGAERDDLAIERAAWPELQKTCERDLFPTFENWNSGLKKRIKPLKFRELRKKAKSMRGLLRITWFDGKSFKTRSLNWLIRIALVLILLIKLALVLGLIWLVVKFSDLLGRLF
ncbi:MAG: hypothetical protein QNK37_27940 [Acidobacteriota bacterium]|nr:hypothetical protein [Acidobacteriota bacterium]